MHNCFMKFIAPLSFILFFLLNSCGNAKESKQLSDALLIKTDSLNILKRKIDSMLAQKNSLTNDLNYWFSEREITQLKEKNIINPVNDISNKLYNNSKLIPYPGVLGGTMRFGKITLLKDRWIIADFDDGHIMGAALYRYSVQKDTSVKWTILDKYLE